MTVSNPSAMSLRRLVSLTVAALAVGASIQLPTARAGQTVADPVVVATFDTGTNPFHPCFRRPGRVTPRDVLPDYPADSEPLELTFKEDYEQSLSASHGAIEAIQDRTLYHVPGTNLSFYGTSSAKDALVDDYPHGAQASSQIACSQYGLGDNSQLVILNLQDRPSDLPDLIGWAADRPWIDIIHLNIQDYPLLIWSVEPELERAVVSGKLVVVAAGNGVYGASANYPAELSRWTPPGTLIAGANDQSGWAVFSNMDPHVVMDGCRTEAAAPRSFGSTEFSGTSSSSPRLTGYAAQVLGRLRAEVGHSGPGLLTIPSDRPRPSAGPLSDGALTASEMHEAIRRTAIDPHESAWDGQQCPLYWTPGVQAYPKTGYGEVSEHTLDDAIGYLRGEITVGPRTEDTAYEASEAARAAFWHPDIPRF